MKKYYLNDGTGQQGPFSLEELQAKNISATTPIWYEGLGEWTTAGQIDELKDIISHAPPPYHAPAEETKPAAVATEKPAEAATPIVVATTTTATAATAATAQPAAAKVQKAKPSKQKTAWLSWVLYLVVLGGVGYLIYQDMEKKKGSTNTMVSNSSPDSTSTANNNVAPNNNNVTPTTSTEKPDSSGNTHAVVVTNEEASKDVAVSPTTTVKDNASAVPPAKTNKTTTSVVLNEKAKTANTKAMDAKAALKKAEDEKQKQQAAAAAAAMKEKEYRNNWPRYVTFGNIDYSTHDGIAPFDVPVYNGTNAMIDKVTVRVDYMKRDKKVFKSETITIYNIPPGGGINGKATGNNKGNNVKVFITGINSRKLHFCFPSSNGTDDPYYCNQ